MNLINVYIPSNILQILMNTLVHAWAFISSLVSRVGHIWTFVMNVITFYVHSHTLPVVMNTFVDN